MKDKHTPAPWFVMEGGFARTGPWAAPTVYATDDELRYVAVCACADHMNFHSATDNLANARLIAAAPDLLRELEHLARLLEPALNGGQAQVPGLATVNGAWLAIAKARGTEPPK